MTHILHLLPLFAERGNSQESNQQLSWLRLFSEDGITGISGIPLVQRAILFGQTQTAGANYRPTLLLAAEILARGVPLRLPLAVT